MAEHRLHVLKLPVRLRYIASSDGTTSVPLVHCPRQGKSIDAEQCTRCVRMETATWNGDGGEVVCAADDAREPASHRRPDFVEAAARCQLHEVVEPVTVCIPAETPLPDVRRLLIERDLRAMPVVDDDVQLVGVISRSDLMKTMPASARVRDVMPVRVHALPEDAPISYAIALMAFENVSEVPVVSETGELVGLVHALDALRWTARQLGYVTPGAGCAADRAGTPSLGETG